jgi:hypothetical protein
MREGSTKWAVPKKADDPFTRKMMGWGPSAYLFDYVDDVLQGLISKEFRRIWEEASTIIPYPKDKDSYSLENITGEQGTEDQLLTIVEKLSWNSKKNKSNFDRFSWRASIDMPKVAYLLQEWGWAYDKGVKDAAKQFIDKFDFNGDGRLSPKEFIIAMIITNKSVVSTNECTNCLQSIVKNTLIPMFGFIDCNNDEKINSSNILIGLRDLKRSSNKQYNFYQCLIKDNEWHTNAVNDFVMKAANSMDSNISKSEFFESVLMGYWSRQVNDLKIVTDDNINMKSLRWSADGMTDLMCERLKLTN